MIPAKVQKLEVELSRRISLLPLLVIPNTNGASLGTTSVEVDGAGPQPSDDIGG
jgi:D-alanine-D-alanine ligase-like ATP-grasp enzyme